MAVPHNGFAPLAYAEERIKELEKSHIDKTAAIKRKEREIGLLSSQLSQLKKELHGFEVEQKQWLEARMRLAAAPPVPEATDRSNGNACHHDTHGEDDEDSEYGNLKAGILVPEEAAAKRKGAEENAHAKRQRTMNAAGAAVSFDAERVLREVADELDGYVNLPTASTVVKHVTGRFIELRCGVCHTNTSEDGVSLLKGWKGMLEHLVTKHERRMERLLRMGSSAHDVVFGHCTFRQLSMEEVEELRDGRKTIQLIEPQRGRPSPEGGNVLEVVTSLQSPKKTGRSRTRSPRRLLARECFVCDTKIRADESRLACKYCTTAIHPSCEATLVEPAHGGCRKEPEDHDMNDFELQEPSGITNH